MQLLPGLAAGGIEVTLLPFLSDATFAHLYDRKHLLQNAAALAASLLRRVIQLPRILGADVLFLQREAMVLGPPWVEWLARIARVPIVLDLDDPTWISVTSPVYGRAGTLLKWPWKADQLIRWARVVVCGNDTIADYVRAAGTPAVVMPTIVDSTVFSPRSGVSPLAEENRGAPDTHPVKADQDVPVIGWVGTHSTWPFVERLLPVLERVAASHPFRLRFVGSAQRQVKVAGVDVELLPWSLEREVHDFQALDIGLYPMPEDSWTVGKSGLKLVQYLCSGVPSIVSPVGIVRSMGIAGVTHLHASTDDQWRDAIQRLLVHAGERRAMSVAARRYAVEHYSVADFAARLGTVIRSAAEGRAEAVA